MSARFVTSLAVSAFLIVASAASRAGAQQTTTDDAAQVRRLEEEVRKLRLETLDLRIEIEQGKAGECERELRALATERQRLDFEVEANAQEILSIDRQMAEPGVGPEEQQQLAARKTEIYRETGERLQVWQNALATREAAAAESLSQRQNRLQRALALRNELSPAEPQLHK